MESIENMDLATVITLFERSTLCEMEFSCSRFSFSGKKEGEGIVRELPQKPQAVKKAVEQQQDDEVETITSPIVGTFYLTPAPDAPAYVKVGDVVDEGAIICTIEAMKMMNQLQTDFPCEIVSVLAKPEEMVEFGQPLFSVRRR